MAATTIGPEARPQAFRRRALLQQQITSIVEQEDGKRTMQYSFAIVTAGFRKMSRFTVIGIDEY
jgi:hypothetical protein